jgi:hypothetical protein
MHMIFGKMHACLKMSSCGLFETLLHYELIPLLNYICYEQFTCFILLNDNYGLGQWFLKKRVKDFGKIFSMPLLAKYCLWSFLREVDVLNYCPSMTSWRCDLWKRYSRFLKHALWANIGYLFGISWYLVLSSRAKIENAMIATWDFYEKWKW